MNLSKEMFVYDFFNDAFFQLDSNGYTRMSSKW